VAVSKFLNKRVLPVLFNWLAFVFRVTLFDNRILRIFGDNWSRFLKARMPDALPVARVSMPPGKSWISYSKISRTWKVVETQFGPGKSWKLKFEVLKSLGVLFWFYTVSHKNVPPLTCYNLYIHASIATIFGKNVDKKLDSQNVLYFPISPNYCFCPTWGNRKPAIFVFSLK